MITEGGDGGVKKEVTKKKEEEKGKRMSATDDTRWERRALSTTYSPFYVPLMVSGLAAAGVGRALGFVESRGQAIVPTGVAVDDWCDWAEALALANGWTSTGSAESLYRFMTSGLPHWGTPSCPYAPAQVQLGTIDALFRRDARLGTAMTVAAVHYMHPLATVNNKEKK